MGWWPGQSRARDAAPFGAASGDAGRGPPACIAGLGPFRPRRSVSRRASAGSNSLARGRYAAGPGPPIGADGLGGRRTRPLYCRTCEPTTRLGCLFEIVETLVLTLIIFVVIQNFVAQPYKVQQQSMEHTLEPDQYVLVDKLTPRFDDYKRGDIVVFTPPADWARRGHAVHQARHRRRRRHRRDPATAWSTSTATPLESRTSTHEPRRPAAADDAPIDQSKWVDPGRRALPDGRPPAELGGFARPSVPCRSSRVIGRAWLRYWPLNTFGILPTPTYPKLAPPSMTRVNPVLAGVALAIVDRRRGGGLGPHARTVVLALAV